MGKLSRALIGPGGRAVAKALKVPEDKAIQGLAKGMAKGGKGLGKALGGGR